MKKNRRVMCFGTFDIIHPGHVKFLEAARQLGDELYVVISRDERRESLQGKRPINSEKNRLFVVQNIKPVTQALLGDKKNILTALKKIDPSIIALGHDQTFGIDVLKKWCSEQKAPPIIKRMPAYNRAEFSSTYVKKMICQSDK
ncbi:MAG: FAD synthase [Candidatus Magasanikbacteria bacterium]|nr:FAD synthase [Candidatus Magasanikbacteria bacterium]